MEFDEAVFLPNDIRGTYPGQVNERFAHALGRALVAVLGVRRVALGMDSRLSSPALCAALAAGVRDAGGEVATAGLCPVELLYYVVGATHTFDLAVMVTASHNPPEFNGFKVIASGAEPVSELTGLAAVRDWMKRAQPVEASGASLPEKTLSPEKAYLQHALRVAQPPELHALKVVVDPGNGTGGLLWEWLGESVGLEPIRMNFEPDGRFPSHDPNPARPENLASLRERVVRERADIGLAYDGDADRTVAVLSDGHLMDGGEVIVALVEHLFGRDPSARCAVSMVVSRKALDFLRARGRDPLIVPVGHAKVKRIMRADPGVTFAGEQSGHYFYREFFCCESSLITTLHLLHMAASDSLQPLVARLPGPWVGPGDEPRFRFERRQEAVAACRAAALAALREFPPPQEILCERDWQVLRHCKPQDIHGAEGVRMDYPHWWFCVRPSMTEPLVRLTGEARSAAGLEARFRLLSRCLASGSVS